MKIQLDTENKTITIEEDVNLHEFFEQINNILPGGLWREFTLKVMKITEWKDPIPFPTPNTPFNPNPFNDPWTTPYGPSITTPGIGDTPINPIWYTTGDINATGTHTTTNGDVVSTPTLNNGTFNLNVV